MKKFLILILLALLVACTTEKTDTDYLDAGLQYLSQQQYRAAVIEFKNALQKNSSNVEARFALGEAYHKLGTHADAVKELQGARLLGKEEDKVFPLLARSLLAINDLAALNELFVTKSLSDASAAEVYAAQAWGHLRAGDQRVANQKITAALTKFPDSIYARYVEARIFTAGNEGSYDEAKEKIYSVLEDDHQFFPALSLLGDIEAKYQRLDEAESAFTRAIEIGSSNPDDLYKRALIRIQMEDHSAAVEDIDQLAEIAPDNPGTLFLQGVIDFGNKRYQEAINKLEVAQNYEDKYPFSLLYLASAYDAQRKFVLAEDYGYRFLSIAPENKSGRMLLASIQLKLSDAESAIKLIEPLLVSEPDNIKLLNLMAAAQFIKGDVGGGILSLERAVKISPSSADVLLRLATAYISSGDYDKAIGRIQHVLAEGEAPEKAYQLLILAHLRSARSDLAVSSAKAYVDKYQDKLAAKNLLARAYIANDEESSAREVYEAVLAIESSNSEANETLAYYQIQAGNYDGARKYYQRVLNSDNSNLGVLLKAAALEEAAEGDSAMLTYLEQAIAEYPQAMQPRILMARYLLFSGQLEKVAPLFNDLDVARGNSNVLNVLGQAKLKMGRYQGAAVDFKQLIKLEPGAPQPQYYLGIALLNIGDSDEAVIALNRALDISPDYLEPRIALVDYFYKGDAEALVKAQPHMAHLDKIAGSDARVLRLKGMEQQLKGNRINALQFFQQSHKANPDSESVLLLAKQMWSVAKKPDTLALLENWVNDNPEDNEVRFELASVYILDGQIDLATAHLEELLNRSKDNLAVLNNLAWINRKDKPAKALDFAQRAVDVAPGSAAALDTHAMVLLENGRVENALREIDRALSSGNSSPSMFFHKVQILIAAGKTMEAKGELKKLLASQAVFPERFQAERLINQL